MKTLTIILNTSLILAIAIVPVIFVINNIGSVGWVIVSIFLALFFVNLEKFEWIKLTFLQAKLRETIKETYAALDDMKDLGLLISEPMIATLAVSGQMFKYIRLESKLESVEKISNMLKKLGATSEEIEQSCSVIYDRVEADLYQRILGNIKPDDWKEKDFYKDFPHWDFSQWNKSKIEKFATENSLEFNQEASEWMEDLDYFLKNKRLRRPDKWQS